MTDTATELVVVPTTGEQLALSAPADELAAVIDFLREKKREIDTVIRLVGDELLSRQDRDASWTTKTERFEIVGQSPAPEIEYDLDALDATLKSLLSEEEISAEAYDNAMEWRYVAKVKKRGLDAIRKLNADVRERVDACGKPVEKTRRVNVKLRREA